MKEKTWILVADGASARVLSVSGGGADASSHIELTLQHDHKRAGDILADRPGRSFSSAGSRRSAMEPSSDPVEVEEGRFIKQIIDELDAKLQQKAFAKIIVVAPPRMLGGLRKAYSGALQDVLAGELNNDLTHHADRDIIAQLRKHDMLN